LFATDRASGTDAEPAGGRGRNAWLPRALEGGRRVPRRATNQQAEIAAATIGLANLKEPCSVTLMSDSRYVVETMGGTWKRKTNHEWWKKLDARGARHNVTWQWVRGHDGHEVQEVADTLARKFAALGHVDPIVLEEAAADLGIVHL
jgi:ribonuclease HI